MDRLRSVANHGAIAPEIRQNGFRLKNSRTVFRTEAKNLNANCVTPWPQGVRSSEYSRLRVLGQMTLAEIHLTQGTFLLPENWNTQDEGKHQE
jgi:hypothetical protein